MFLDGTESGDRMGVSHQGLGAFRSSRLSRLPAHLVRIPVNDSEGRNSSARIRLRVRHPHHYGREHNYQICVARFWASIWCAVGKQGGVSLVHRARHRTNSGHSLHRVRLFNGEDLHLAAVCFPTDVLHHQVSLVLSSCQLSYHWRVSIFRCIQKLQESTQRRDSLATCDPQHEYFVSRCDLGRVDTIR